MEEGKTIFLCLAHMSEEGWEQKPETNMILRKYLLHLKSCHIDTLILGCTHYPILASQIAKKMGKRVRIISSSSAAALKLVDYLERHPEIEEKLEKNKAISFYTTDDGEKFEELGSRFLGRKIKKDEVRVISL